MTTPEDDEPAGTPKDDRGGPPAVRESSDLADPPSDASDAPGDDAAEDAESSDGDELIGPYIRMATRVARAFRGLLAAHIIVVRNEVQREILRLMIGVGLLMTAGMASVCTALLGAVTLVTAVQRLTGLPLLESLLICVGVLGGGALLFALMAWLILRRPLMPESRELIAKTLDGFAARAGR